MKKLIIFMLLLSGLGSGNNSLLAQDVLWNRMFVSRGPDFGYGIVEFDTNNYFVLGNNRSSIQHRMGWTSGMSITRINGIGDTLWSRYAGFIGTLVYGFKLNNHQMIALGQLNCFNPPCSSLLGLRTLVKLDTTGRIVDTSVFRFNNRRIGNSSIQYTQKKEILIGGSVSPSYLGNGPFDWWVAKYDTNLNLIWQNAYNPRSPIADACVASEDFNGRYMLSGQKFDGVAYIPIDSNGRQLDTAKTLLRNPYNGYGILGPFAKRHPDGSFIVSMKCFNPFGSIDNSSAVIAKVGANLQPEWVITIDTAWCGIIKPIINSDGSIIFCFVRKINHATYSSFVAKISSSGQFLYNKLLASANTLNTLIYQDMAYRPDESAIFVGHDIRNASDSYDLVITKISRVGSPFNPVSLEPVYKRGGKPFPNPCISQLTVPGGRVQGLQMVNILGQPFTPQATQTAEGLVLDTEQLPVGMYQLTVLVDGKTHQYKVLKQ